ncbi:slipin family protein [Nonomuraea roseoviolacea]|uniref:Regulator of protease activity HflC (Stomatin/prohibitin superfamily) n=1 Tax=Nonomuraea roseoviolacea subsp. carminata TaxID=160689 RepID=A0ABT1K618_9ACTN|nr:slipin family protein [Nonomuraea roseoviolacea]MCP2349059.1 regulator of protease activity HflC (stomatin/prohibitin superfamily) [Nonomuraea roseoviolacea subsp. carminata]
MDINIILTVIAFFVILVVLSSLRVVNQVERGIIFRFGRAQKEIRQPGLTVLIPFADRMKKVNIQIVTMPVPTQEGITRDNVSVRVDAVAYFRVKDPMRAAIEVQDYVHAVEQVAQTSLRSIIGKSELDDLLTNREELNRGLALMIDSPALGWGIHIDRVEIKDVQLPDTMKRSMSRQAEAERERRARVIVADGELRAAQKLADASGIMSQTPGALQLRLLQTVVEVAAEKNSTLIMPLPVELLRFFDRAAQAAPQAAEQTAEQGGEAPAAEGPSGPGELEGGDQPSLEQAPAEETPALTEAVTREAVAQETAAREKAVAQETAAREKAVVPEPAASESRDAHPNGHPLT